MSRIVIIAIAVATARVNAVPTPSLAVTPRTPAGDAVMAMENKIALFTTKFGTNARGKFDELKNAFAARHTASSSWTLEGAKAYAYSFTARGRSLQTVDSCARPTLHTIALPSTLTHVQHYASPQM